MFRFHSKKTAFVLVALLLTAIIFSLQSSDISKPVAKEPANNNSWPSQRELRRAIWHSQQLLIVYATGDAEVGSAFKDFATQISERFRRIQTKVKPDTLVTQRELRANPGLILGKTFRSEHIQKLISELPFHFGEKQFKIDNFFESSNDDVCLLTNYPNPENRQMPISLLIANNTDALFDFISGFDARLFRGSEFRVFRENKAVVIGFFKESTGEPWEVDHDKSINYLQLKQSTLESDHYKFQFIGKGNPAIPLEDIAEKHEDRLKALLFRLESATGTIPDLPKIRFFIYESAEDKGLMTGNTDLSHYDAGKWEIHAILNDAMNGLDFFADAKMLMANLLGTDKNPVLTSGIGIYFSVDWMKQGYRHWVKTFYDSNNINPLSDLFDRDICSRESYLFMLALSGSFTDFLIHKYGWTDFLKIYQSWPEWGFPDALNQYGIAKLQDEWLSFIETNYRKSETWSQKSEIDYPVFQKGFCYAHEGYQIYNGYLSTKGLESLSKLNALGTNWISITPFGYLDDKNKPGYFHYSFGAGSENDESLVTAAYQARQLGMRSMLKPHILMNSRNFGWPGDVKMQTEADWQKFFKYYKSWIRHYALLAEIYNFDILSSKRFAAYTAAP